MFLLSAALKDCWLLALTSWLFFLVFGLFSFRLFFLGDGRRWKAGEQRSKSRPASPPGMLMPAALLSEVDWLRLWSCVLETSLLQSLFCTRSTWRRSHCNINKVRGSFDSAALKDCCVVELATLLFLFLVVGFLFQVLCLQPLTGDTLHLRPRRAASRLQTDISHADRDFSLALAVLHAVDVASLALQHNNVRWGILSLSSAKRLLAR